MGVLRSQNGKQKSPSDQCKGRKGDKPLLALKIEEGKDPGMELLPEAAKDKDPSQGVEEELILA